MNTGASPFAGVDAYIRGLEERVETLSRAVSGLQERLDAITTRPEDLPLTLADFLERYPEFRSGIRWKLAHRQANGLAAAVVEPERKGGRLRIIPSKFIAWVQGRLPEVRLDGTKRRPRR